MKYNTIAVHRQINKAPDKMCMVIKAQECPAVLLYIGGSTSAELLSRYIFKISKYIRTQCDFINFNGHPFFEVLKEKKYLKVYCIHCNFCPV